MPSLILHSQYWQVMSAPASPTEVSVPSYPVWQASMTAMCALLMLVF